MIGYKAEGLTPKEGKFIIFVCTGNTCRSPMAEGLANYLFRMEALDGMWHALSAGTVVYGRFPAVPEAVRVMNRFGIDISTHRTRNIRDIAIVGDTLFVGMTSAHVYTIKNEITGSKGNVIRLYDLYLECGGSANKNASMFLCKNGDIPDPIGNSDEIYFDIATTIKNLLLPVIETIKRSPYRLPLFSR